MTENGNFGGCERTNEQQDVSDMIGERGYRDAVVAAAIFARDDV
jgi:hypothetical protein